MLYFCRMKTSKGCFALDQEIQWYINYFSASVLIQQGKAKCKIFRKKAWMIRHDVSNIQNIALLGLAGLHGQ